MRVTSFKNFLNNIKEQFPNDEIVDVATCEEIEQRLIRHTNILLEFERIQGSIDELTEDLKETIEAREKFESEYYMVLKYANNLLRRGQSTKVVPLQGQANEQRGIQQENSTIAHNFEHLSLQNNQTLAVQSSSTRLRINQTNIPGVKLPIIELPKFKGDLSDWLKFRDTYKSIIHDNPNISNIQKFHYLMSSLEGSATQVIDEYEYTEQNYEIVWEALHRRYNDPKLLIHNHIEAMFKSKPILNESSEQLNEIVDSITKHTRALKKLEEPTEYWDSLLIYLIVTKLDVDTAREWEEQRLKLAEKPKLEDLLKCLRARATLLQTIERKKGIIKTKKITPGKTSTLLTKKVSCAFCKGEHYIQNCSNFLKLSPQERSERVKQLRLCTNCLRKGHYSKECTFGACRKCNSKHNSLLHFEKGDQSEAKESTAATMCAANHAKVLNEPNVIIATALVGINNSNKFKEQTRALLDSCSQSNFISERLCKKLKLEKIPIDVQVMSLNQAGPKINYKCEVEIVSRTSGFRFKTVCLVIPKLVDDVMPNEVIPLNDVQIPSHLKLADPSFQTPGQVDLLLGAQWFWEILCVGQIKLSNNLIMQKTRLGWIVGGPMSAPAQKIVKCNILKNVNLEQQLTKFWELEEAPITKAWSQEEKDCESYFVKTTRRNNDGRFIVNMPLKESPKVLGESRHQAERRLINLEKRLKRTPELNSSYRAFLKEYEQLGHMTEVNESLTVPYVYYLPHHCVVKSESQTTKVRVVFDASASTTSGKSLNDIQMTGPVIQNDLFSIIIRFRKHAFIVSSDVTKMYRQVLIEEQQRPLQRILWRENSEDPIKTFQLNTVTYGTTSGSFQAIRCLHQLGIECERNRPEIAKIIFNDFYVDDMLTGSDTKEGAISIAEQVAQVLAAGGFKLQKWASNCSEVLNKIQEGKEALTNIQFTSDGQRKTLGVSWNTLADVLIYLVDVPKSKKITKRHILSVTSRIFDPLGLLAPCIIPAKIMLQKLWLEKLSWDESLPSELHNRWLQYSEQLTELNNLQILRQVVIKCYKSIQIHGFSDASKDAYGACIYVRSTDSEENVKVSLLCAKTRVAPLKTQTIPRLELCAAHALAKLVTTVVSALNTDIESITLWCDSTIVLSWIATQPNLLAVFESNRVARIQELTVGWAWRHVPTQENPADCLSRGATPREIQRDHMWWNGPTFLKKSSKDWPLLQTAEPIRQKTKSMLIKRTSENLVIDALFTKFSNLPKIVRIISYCRRFARRLKTKQATKGVISAEEYKGSLIELAKYSQLKAFQEEIELISSGKVNTKGRLTSLTPFLDDEKILRAGGRLKNSLFSMDKKHPIILAADQIFTKRLFEDMHIRLLHAGPSLLLASIREQFWPLGGRNLARRVVHACATCFRANPKSLQALMGHLPRARVSADFPFSITGVDYAGPFLIKDKKGRGCKIHKCYVSVFVCFVTKALHLELVSDLTKEAFIAALRRFVSRRGKPAHIYSDNGTTFVGSNNALIEFGKFIAKEVKNLSETIEDLGISWHFIPSYSPHFGGLWEAGVKATKYHLKRVAGNAHLTFEELCTLLAQVEALLNSRPLTPLSTDPNECAPLTPAHFLIGRTFISAPDPSLAHIKETRLSNWQRIQQLQQNFWERWNKEYISELQQRTKWKTPFPPLEINTLVLLKEDNLPPAKWRLGRVTEVHVGSDGIARVASVRTASGITRRAFPKLCPLPRDETLAHP
ncbi:uncharacterized protein LOC120360046 [Solenopsis invicta]|uniref:uncharacterized protein LOC120360046 n=1 Tax=Solenopsis invicta TaxID=13686 RepID=UPI00193D0995|nr:uncharacterized protein LOC120360046 [Solenopsis invicta]